MSIIDEVAARFQSDSVCITEVNPLKFARVGDENGESVTMVLPTYANKSSVRSWVMQNKGRCLVVDRFRISIEYKDTAGTAHQVSVKTDYALIAVTSDNRFFSVTVDNLDKNFVQV